MTLTRDSVYENELKTVIDSILKNLDKKSQKPTFELDDYYAIERMLQILIEALIGLARYTLKIVFDTPCAKSSEAFNELFKHGIFTEEELSEIKKMIGYRNILVHDYLNTNPAITASLIKTHQYRTIQTLQTKLLTVLNTSANL